MRTIARGIKQGNRSSSAVDFWRKKGFQGSRSQLVSMQMISTTQSQVSFAILQTQPNNAGLVYGFEKRLNISDAFVVLSIGLFLGRTTTTTTNANPTNAQAAITRLHTFPNSTVFAGAGEAANLEAVYNSSLNIKVGQVNWFPSIHTRKFYRVGQAQQGAGPSVVTPASEWDGSDYGLLQLVPTITLNGNGNNEFTVTLPDSVNTAVPGTTTLAANSLVLVLDGIILPNAAGKIDLETKNTFATQFGQ